MNNCEFILAFFDEGELGDRLIGGNFLAIHRDGVAGDEVASFAFAAGEAGLDEDIDELGAEGCGREILGK